MKPLLVGELNPYGADPEMALYPLPEEASGGRLARILGLSRGEYLRRFDRVNLCVGRWSMKAAREVAEEIARRRPAPPIVTLGSKVIQAFGMRYRPFTVCGVDAPERGVYVLPHPSGRNLIWNKPGMREKARELLHDFLGQPCEPHHGTDGLYHPECDRCRNVTQMVGGTL